MIKRTAYDIAFILLLTLICHLLFSSYGFNPTDEGFVLSATNRVLHGQIPHLDFSSVRPLGYAYLHIPELLICKSCFFMISRFVFWLENVLIAFLWIRFVLRSININISAFNFYLLTIIAFIFNVHYFPCSVLHTIDGLLFCLIGLNIISTQKKYSFTGFFFIGFATLCKQNYLLILPISVMLFNRNEWIKNLITGLVPIALYIGIISLYGGFNDIRTQLTGHNELFEVGFKNYFINIYLYIGIAICFLSKKIKVLSFLFSIGLFLMMTVLLATNHYHGNLTFIIFGVLLVELWDDIAYRKIVFLGLVIAWSVSISVGYNTPALFAGGCLTLILLKWNKEYLFSNNKMLVAFSIVGLGVFYFVRTTNNYRENSATQLTYKIDNLVEGGCCIKTNKNTYAVLKELDSLKHTNAGIIVLPDFTACNIMHSHQSPIGTEWPNKTEIPNDKILWKVAGKIISEKSAVFAVTKYQTALLKDGFIPVENGGMNYPIVKFVKQRYKKITETNYFEIYRK